MKAKLLTRDEFREGVFRRDQHLCVVCRAPAVDAHHLLERRLWGDGGYYLDNGVSVCGPCHVRAEQTLIGVDELRTLARITNVVLPEHFTEDQAYDKWGNPLQSNGTRLRGELFGEEPVQKMLAEGGVLSLFTDKVKFPRTFHLPWSPGCSGDDKMLSDPDPFHLKQVVVTVKMDGENTTMYRDYLHARSLSYAPHPSRNWVKQLHARIAEDIPPGWRVCGENLYARHSIEYRNLPDYFLVFSVWDEKNTCLSWDDTKEWAALLGLKTVPVLYEGVGDKRHIEKLYTAFYKGDPCEGHVVRRREAFPYRSYRTNVGKYVRAGHVTTDQHWAQQQVVPNGVQP